METAIVILAVAASAAYIIYRMSRPSKDGCGSCPSKGGCAGSCAGSSSADRCPSRENRSGKRTNGNDISGKDA